MQGKAEVKPWRTQGWTVSLKKIEAHRAVRRSQTALYSGRQDT